MCPISTWLFALETTMCTVDDVTSPTLDFAYPLRQHLYFKAGFNMGVSENRLSPIVPNGFADHYPYISLLNGYFIGY